MAREAIVHPWVVQEVLVGLPLPLEQPRHPVRIGQQVLRVVPAVGPKVAQVGSHPLGEPLEDPVVLRVAQVVLQVGQVASR